MLIFSQCYHGKSDEPVVAMGVVKLTVGVTHAVDVVAKRPR